MQDNSELTQLLLNPLNLSIQEVESVSSSRIDDKLSLTVSLKQPADHSCPICGSVRTLSRGYYSKRLFLAYDAFAGISVVIRVPRRWCPDCRSSFSDSRHLNPRNSSVNYDVVLQIMKLLQNPEMTFTLCAELTGVSESTVVRTFDKHFHITRATFPEALCIDEVYTRPTDFKENGRYSKYSCVF